MDTLKYARGLLIVSALTLLALIVADPRPAQSRLAAAQGDSEYGSVTGQFVLEGTAPARQVLIKAGDGQVKDASICAAQDVLSDELVVDGETGGIAHIFVYLLKAPKVHPDLKDPPTSEVVFDQQGCRFVPHALVARANQTVLVKSDDDCAHNTHTFPIRGQAVNFLLQPKERKGIPVVNKIGESLPMEVKCDIHPWMRAYWLVLDHPYAAVTNAQGQFKIEKLPAGEHEFRVWHEKVGYIDRKFKVTVTGGKTQDLGAVKVPVARFSE